MSEETPVRPVYRHIVVKRRNVAQLVADPELLRKAIRQQREIKDGEREKIDLNLQHLIKRNHLRNTMKNVYGKDMSDEAADGVSSSWLQGGAIVVATLHKEKIPGGTEPLPAHATFWTQQVNLTDKDPQDSFMEAAVRLQERFQKHSDMKFKLLPSGTAAGMTLVTVAYSPIVAFALDPKFHATGFEVGMEFTQKTRFGRVETKGFEVYSEDGTYPVKPPEDGYMMMLMKSVDEIGSLRGFLTEEQRSS